MARNPLSDEFNRITALEEKLAHQNVVIEELSATIAQQWLLVDKMRIKLDALTHRFLSLEEVTGPAPEITKPPHY